MLQRNVTLLAERESNEAASDQEGLAGTSGEPKSAATSERRRQHAAAMPRDIPRG